MRIIIITSTYPFPPGEQFLETEIVYWEKSKLQVYILPLSVSEIARPVPSNITVDNTLNNMRKGVFFVLKACLSKYLVLEIFDLISRREITLKKWVIALRSVATYLRAERNLLRWLKSHGPIDLAYTYWNEKYTYAACVAKKKGLLNKVVSRIHGGDLYEETRPLYYMPLKRQFINDIDRLYLLSESAKQYCIKKYGVYENKCRISPLGVNVPSHISKCSTVGHFTIVSVSFIVTVKRIDKIIKSIAQFASIGSNLRINWVHIGDGPLKQDMVFLAKKYFRDCPNISWKFLGHLTNREVLLYYKENPVDCFLNTSESEGIPVSIMEAMASGVPAIAPNIGGIADLISEDCGILLSERPSIREIVDALIKMEEYGRFKKLRKASKVKVRQNYNANINYQSFIREIENLPYI